jgi:hypothetical protein
MKQGHNRVMTYATVALSVLQAFGMDDGVGLGGLD